MGDLIELKLISPDDDLAAVAASMVGKDWGKDNEMGDYSEEKTRAFVADPGNVLLIAYVDRKVAGVILANTILAPYKGNKNWLFVDEADVHPDFRRRGVGKALMEKVFDIAKEMNLPEVWLGTEPDNKAANALYKSFKQDEIEQFIGYTYKLKLAGKKI